MNKHQKEEFAKLLLDIGKLSLASLVLSFFQTKADPLIVFTVSTFGLTVSVIFFILGLRLLSDN